MLYYTALSSFEIAFVVLLCNVNIYTVLLSKILYTIKLQCSMLFLDFCAYFVSIHLHILNIEIKNRFFYFSDSPNAWFLDLDITDAGNSLVASYTDGFVQILDVSANVRYFISILLPFSKVFVSLHLSRMNISIIFLRLLPESSLLLRYFFIGCAVCFWDNITNCLHNCNISLVYISES